MKKQLIHISPLRAGIVLGVLYGLVGLILAPFFLLGAVFGNKAGFGGTFFAILFPVFYAVAGFIGGILISSIYNLVAKWTGGLEFEVRDLPPVA